MHLILIRIYAHKFSIGIIFNSHTLLAKKIWFSILWIQEKRIHSLSIWFVASPNEYRLLMFICVYVRFWFYRFDIEIYTKYGYHFDGSLMCDETKLYLYRHRHKTQRNYFRILQIDNFILSHKIRLNKYMKLKYRMPKGKKGNICKLEFFGRTNFSEQIEFNTHTRELRTMNKSTV